MFPVLRSILNSMPLCAPPPPPGYGPWFEAAYPGDCDGGCGDGIEPGDQIRSDGGGWLCVTCGDRGGGLHIVPVDRKYL